MTVVSGTSPAMIPSAAKAPRWASVNSTSTCAAAGNAGAGLVALGWRALWLTFWASGVPTILWTVTGVLGLRQARLSPPWVSALGWLSAAAHVLVLFTLAQRGPFAPDGIIAGIVPLTTVIWILALAATLPRSRRAAVPATLETGG